MREFNKALFIQLRRIGDVLMCTPAIRAFKNTFPDCCLDFLTEVPRVLYGNPYVDSIICVDANKHNDILYQIGLVGRIRSKRYDLVVDFFANPRSAYYSFLSGAGVRLSYGFRHRRWAYNLIAPKAHGECYAATDRLRLLEHVGVFSDDARLDFFISDEDRTRARKVLEGVRGKRLVSLSPVSRRRFNRWPLERYAQLGVMLAEGFGATVVILAGPGEEKYAESVAAMMEDGVAVVLRADTLGLLGAVFEMVSLHIGNDNGPKHIAVACGTPTFTIYGPHSHISWTFPDSSRHGWIRPADTDPQCGSRDHICGERCISKIPVESVWQKVQKLAATLPAFQTSLKER